MNIWIDGDACPNPIKQILFRAAMKRHVPLVIVANHWISTPSSPYIQKRLVEAGFDKADHYIVDHLNPFDLVITADIILADQVLQKNGLALNPRGTLYSHQNMKTILTMRNLNESLRSHGLIHGGPQALNSQDIQKFSNHLDHMITRHHRPLTPDA